VTTLSRRHDFVLIFDVSNGNPNGDPDAGNLPRLDPETNHGLVSDVSLKRKIRNYVDLARPGESGHHIYVQEGAILNEKHREAFLAKRADDEKALKAANEAKKLNPKDDAEAKALRDWMCANFFDVRTFGAVMSTGINCGQVKGPVQMTFASSVEPILPVEISITRMAATNEAEQKKRAEGDDSDTRTDNRTMGRKHIVPYGLYVAHGFISAKFAERTGFSDADLDLLFEALAAMFEHDRSAARGMMTTRRLIDFVHDNALGNAPAHTLFDRVRIGRNVDGTFRDLDDKGLGNLAPARKFSDYIIEIDREDLPAGVEIREIV
jgi:CRISPR-associated protein Csd2